MPNYDQNLADDLKERYLLAASTIRNWKHRQHIPDRYIQGYVTRQRTRNRHQPYKTMVTTALY